MAGGRWSLSLPGFYALREARKARARASGMPGSSCTPVWAMFQIVWAIYGHIFDDYMVYF